MTTETATFTCSICGEPSTDICVYCTKDSCRNHRCQRCKRCSDCCECEVPLSASDTELEEPAVEQPAPLATAAAGPEIPQPPEESTVVETGTAPPDSAPTEQW